MVRLYTVPNIDGPGLMNPASNEYPPLDRGCADPTAIA